MEKMGKQEFMEMLREEGKKVFNFARFDTGKLTCPFAKNSLRPDINISLIRIIIAAITSKFFIVPSITNKIRAVATIILSAIGSKSSPSLDSSLYNLAKSPSKKSVKDARTNKKNGITSP